MVIYLDYHSKVVNEITKKKNIILNVFSERKTSPTRPTSTASNGEIKNLSSDPD